VNTGLSLEDITSYLDVNGWERQPDGWRGALVWAFDDRQVLVPDRDGYADGPRRVREIVRMLAEAEGRTPAEVAADIAAPTADVQWYRAPAVTTDGLSAMAMGLTGIRDVLAAAARVVVDGPRAEFAGTAPKPVRELLAAVKVGPGSVSGDVLTVRVPLERNEPDSLARRTLLLLHQVMPLVRDAVEAAGDGGNAEGFDELVRDGVSADLCAALARFSGPHPGLGFDVGFRWARAMPAEAPERVVAFGPGSRRALRTAANRLKRLRSGEASVTGFVGMLFDNGIEDRFRVQIHGTVLADSGRSRNGLWVRLPDEATYDRAVEAHRARTRVRAEGVLRIVHDRHELTDVRFTPLADDDPH
jgi:hypothetical protein